MLRMTLRRLLSDLKYWGWSYHIPSSTTVLKYIREKAFQSFILMLWTLINLKVRRASLACSVILLTSQSDNLVNSHLSGLAAFLAIINNISKCLTFLETSLIFL